MKIVYKNWTFQDAQTESAGVVQEQSLNCESISADTLTVSVRCSDASIINFRKNDPVKFWMGDSDAIMKTFYLRSVSRTGAQTYKIIAWSAVSLLAASRHVGGIYTGQTLQEIVKEICGDIPVLVESAYSGLKLYGWLPYAQPTSKGQGKSARDNLAQVLFAAGAYLGADQNGVLRIEKLWDGESLSVEIGRMYLDGGSVSYGDPVSAISVTEHQYVANSDEKELFSGTTQTGDIVTFSEPMHSLTAEGFTILESNANYAKLSAGTGTLRGKTYTHNTRLVTRTVTKDATENVISVTDATLVSLVNSVAVANRLAEYYKHRETISNGVVAGAEKPGHVVSIYHPYDKKMVSACVESLDTTMSGTIKSNLVALVGFKPPQPETAEYFSERVLLTGSGTWTAPEGAETLTAVLIGDGQDGTPGADGEGVVVVGKTIQGTCSGSFSGTSAGKGGKAGTPGAGGKIFQLTMDITAGSSFAYQTSIDGESIFGEHSSAEGAASATGYYDDVVGKTYGRQGADGYDGGDGGGIGQSGKSVAGFSGGDPRGEQNYTRSQTIDDVRYTQTFKAQSSGGSGAAMGGEGKTGVQFTCGLVTFTPYIQISGDSPGASAVPGADGENYGDGGGAGHGGGGAGAIGSCSISISPTPPSSKDQRVNFTGDHQSGGTGSEGGKGKPGCIILFYGKKKTIDTGPLASSDGYWLLDKLGRWLIV